MNPVSETYQIPPDPQPTKAELESALRGQDNVYLDEFAARWIASILWRAKRREAEPDAFVIPSASEVRVIPDGHLAVDSYFNGERWNDIRRLVMQRAAHRCECCGAWATDIHVRDYRPRVLLGEDIMPLVAVCRYCFDNVNTDPATGWERTSYDDKELALNRIYGRQSAAGPAKLQFTAPASPQPRRTDPNRADWTSRGNFGQSGRKCPWTFVSAAAILSGSSRSSPSA